MIVQLDIGSTQQVKSLCNLLCAHQTRDRKENPKKSINRAIFDTVDFRKFYVEIDGLRYSRHGVLINYEENIFIAHYKGLKLFYRDYLGETFLAPFLSYPDRKGKQIIHSK